MYVCRYIEDLGVFSVPNYTYDMVDRGQATCSIEQGTPSVQISKDFIPKFFIFLKKYKKNGRTNGT